MDLKRSTDKRRFHRAPFKRAVKLRAASGEVAALHIALDISQGGVRVNVGQFIPLGEHVGIEVQLEDMAKMSVFEAKVVWVKQLPYSEMYQVGMEFAEGSSFDKWRVSQYVAKAETNP